MLRAMRSRLPLLMLIGLALGAGLGVLANFYGAGSPRLEWIVSNVSRPVGQVFIRLLLMLVIPLIFSALALGVAGLGDLRRLGRLGLKTLGYTVVLSAVAVGLGVGLVNIVRPGEGVSAAARATLIEGAAERARGLPAAPAPKTGIDLLVQIVPDNPVKAAASGDMLGFIFFSLLLGIGLALTHTDAARRFKEVLEGVQDVSMRLIGLVIAVAPIGACALLFTLTAEVGFAGVALLGRYVLVVLAALAFHQFVVYSVVLKLLGRTSPWAFFRGIREAMLTAFATASSNATLPTALRVADENLTLPRSVGRFVLTVGATMNQNGTALFEGVTVLFLAQLYGVELALSQQVLVVLTCILGGIGTAGVPAGSIPVVAIILGMVGVPVEAIGVVLGVDRFLDMCRTTLNVTGDLVAAVVLSRGESEVGAVAEA